MGPQERLVEHVVHCDVCKELIWPGENEDGSPRKYILQVQQITHPECYSQLNSLPSSPENPDIE